VQSGGTPQFNTGQAAGQQTTANVNAAVNQQRLNMIDQVTPYGNLTYSQSGGEYDYDGNFIPKYTATQTLAPGQQQILDKTTGVHNQALDIAPGLLRNVNDAIGKPLDFSGAPAMPGNGQQLRDQAYEALMSRSRQEIGRARAAGETQAANQGIAPGSEAWKRATQGFDESLVDAGNQAFINAGNVAGQNLEQSQALRNQWINELLTQRQQPISDLTALLGFGGQNQNPSLTNTPQTNVNATDTNSLNMANYQGQLEAARNATATTNAMLGGLFGLGGAGLFGLAKSDIRAKENIRLIGQTFDGQNLYIFNYRGQPGFQIGLMAQEVELRDPGAVVTGPDGMKLVDYDRALGIHG